MSYLARLKALNLRSRYLVEPSKPSKAAFEPFEGSLAGSNSESAPVTPASLSNFDGVAIVQEYASVPADWARGFAEIKARPVPRGVDQAAWRAMLGAAGQFLQRWGGPAAALGWSAAEVFSLDDGAPINRRDKRGAAFFLVGAEVVAVTNDTIRIRVRGALQSVYRRRQLARRAWENETPLPNAIHGSDATYRI